jgi:MFS family permease
MAGLHSGRAPDRGVNYGLLIPLMVHGMVVQTLTGLIRVTTSYRIVELDLPVVWLGAISATFAILPVFLAVFVGRFIDRGFDTRAAQIGSGIFGLGALGLWFLNQSAVLILVSTAVMGIGHLFLMASHQMLCVRAAGDRNRDAVFGNFLVATGVGQGLGPYIVALVGGAATVPDTGLLFTYGGVGAIVSIFLSLLLRSPTKPGAEGRHVERVPLTTLLKTPGFIVVLLAGINTITAQDLVTIYLPLLGTERHIDAGTIGTMLTVRSGAAIVSRLFYAWLIAAMGRVPLTVWSMILSGLSFAALALPISQLGMYVAAACMGLGLGIATTLSLTSIVELVPPAARATAVSLRITGNRIGQVTLPLVASVLAAATGAPGVLMVIGVSLGLSAVSVHVVRSGRE